MKSRFLLPSDLTTLRRSPNKSGVLVRPATERATDSVVRRFESKHNASPRFARRRQERRQGQALLLAVLIMLLAALLSAGFLAVVSGNLNQSARIADKTRAIEASRAGIAYANAQLLGSSKGDLWRPVDVSPAPVQGNIAYNQYYSQLDKVQGWANTRVEPVRPSYPAGFAGDAAFAQADSDYRNSVYSKFPAPDQAAGDAPKFLVKVEEIPTDPLAAGYDAEHAGEIKITSIGLSNDDPNVFHRAVAYKMGRKQSPWATAFRSVSNWDFRTNQVPSTTITLQNTIQSSQTPVNVTVDQPIFSDDDVPFNIVIGQKQGFTRTQGAVVTAVGSDRKTLTLDHLESPLFPDVKHRIELAAAVGTAPTIDLFNTGTPTQFPTTEQPNGIRANGGLWLQGQIQLSNLSKNGTTLRSSGVIAVPDPFQPPGPNNIAAIGPASSASQSDVATNGNLAPSNLRAFPGNFTTVNGVARTDLIDDAWERTNPVLGSLTYSNTRNVEPFKPADIASKANRDRYRNLARSSAVGAYIDNAEDYEKIGTANGPRPMTQKELMRMWLSPADAAEDFARGKLLSATLPVVSARDKSLEEQHLRGWIGTDEFLARGALVDIRSSTNNDPGPDAPRSFIRVTLDSRADNTPTETRNATGPVDSKAWRNAGGVLEPNVYVKEFAWPTNGVIFAEGNIRIRGSVFGTPNSLTVVSMGNIYVEGSVGVDFPHQPVDRVNPNPTTVINNNRRRKLMLLARKNVVVNPTRLTLGHVEAQTRTVTASQGLLSPRQIAGLSARNTTNFKAGDVIETTSFTINQSTDPPTFTPVPGVRGVVTNVGFDNLSIYVLVGGRVPSNSTISTVIRDARDATGANPKFLQVNSASALSRRVLLGFSEQFPNLRVALDHYGARKPALTVATQGALTKPDNLQVFLDNKRNNPFVQDLTQVETADKLLNGEYNLPATGSPDTFPDAAMRTATYSLNDLKAAMEGTAHPIFPVDDPPKGWNYSVTPAAGMETLPLYFLSGIGLRYNPNPDTTTTSPINPADPTTWRSVDIGGQATYAVPLATSVSVLRNGQPFSLTPAQIAVPNVTALSFGFNPIYSPSGGDTAQEDRLTVDQSFYQADTATDYSTLDSRRLIDNNNNNTPLTLANGDVLTFQQNKSQNVSAAQAQLLPDYRIKAVKLENTFLPASTQPFSSSSISPIDMTINAYVYAQEGRWFVIPGDYFRPDAPIGARVSNNSLSPIAASYIDYDKNGSPDAGEYVNGTNANNDANNFDDGDFADLNRNGTRDPGEMDAVLRFLRYNYKLNYYGAIVENKTAQVNGGVSEWMDKWAAYSRGNNALPGWSFINYVYDPSIAIGTLGSQSLRVPQTDDLLYQQ